MVEHGNEKVNYLVINNIKQIKHADSKKKNKLSMPLHLGYCIICTYKRTLPIIKQKIDNGIIEEASNQCIIRKYEYIFAKINLSNNLRNYENSYANKKKVFPREHKNV